MGRDTETIEEETNGRTEIITKIITQEELTNLKLDEILRLLKKVIPEDEPVTEGSKK